MANHPLTKQLVFVIYFSIISGKIDTLRSLTEERKKPFLKLLVNFLAKIEHNIIACSKCCFSFKKNLNFSFIIIIVVFRQLNLIKKSKESTSQDVDWWFDEDPNFQISSFKSRQQTVVESKNRNGHKETRFIKRMRKDERKNNLKAFNETN